MKLVKIVCTKLYKTPQKTIRRKDQKKTHKNCFALGIVKERVSPCVPILETLQNVYVILVHYKSKPVKVTINHTKL